MLRKPLEYLPLATVPLCCLPALGDSAMNQHKDLLAIASVLPGDAAYEIGFVPASNERPAHYLATVADSKRTMAGFGATRGDALEEAVDRYLKAHRGDLAA